MRCNSLFRLLAATSFISRAESLSFTSASTRRAFVGATAAFSTSTFLPSNTRQSFADALEPLSPPPGSTAPLRPGGMARFQPEIYDNNDWVAEVSLDTKLGRSRILSQELAPLPQNLPFGDQDLYYAPFLFGAWNVTATLQRKIYPYGSSYVPSTSLLTGSPRNRNEKVGNVCNYQVNYFSTSSSADSSSSPISNGKIIQDRSFNAKSMSKAYQQLTPVQDVTWDYQKSPSKVVLDFGAGLLTEDMMPLGPRRAEIFLTARQGETAAASVFCGAERSRAVTLAPGNVIVADTETVTEFHQSKDTDNHVQAVSRIAVFLSPNPNSREGILWQQVGGKAVAFFDYSLDMRRLKDDPILAGDENANEKKGAYCVKTPDDTVQCV